mgnify:CR=1 FL=1
MNKSTINGFFDLAAEYLDYLKFYSTKVAIPKDTGHKIRLKELTAIEQDLSEFFAEAVRQLVRKFDLTAEQLEIAETVIRVKVKRRKSFTVDVQKGVRPKLIELQYILETENLPEDIRENARTVQGLLKRFVKFAARWEDDDKESRKTMEIESWQDQVGDLLSGWRRKS